MLLFLWIPLGSGFAAEAEPSESACALPTRSVEKLRRQLARRLSRGKPTSPVELGDLGAFWAQRVAQVDGSGRPSRVVVKLQLHAHPALSHPGVRETLRGHPHEIVAWSRLSRTFFEDVYERLFELDVGDPPVAICGVGTVQVFDTLRPDRDRAYRLRPDPVLLALVEARLLKDDEP